MIEFKSDKILLTICVAIYWVYFFYLTRMFENDRNYQFLTEREREISLTSEQALYYHYYKYLTSNLNANISTLIKSLSKDYRSQAPTPINALQQYNLIPELLIGLVYRFSRFIVIDIFQNDFEAWHRCYYIEYENESNETLKNLNTRLSCEGLGEPFYFYVNAVFALNSFVPVLIGLIAFYLFGRSYCSLLFAVSIFALHQTDSSRVQWAIALRENFGYPLFLMNQLWFLRIVTGSKKSHHPIRINKMNFILMTFGITLQLLCWQFSSFILCANLIALYLSFELLPRIFYISNVDNFSDKFSVLLRQYFQINFVAILFQSSIQLGNVFVLRSPYFILVSSYLSTSLFLNRFDHHHSFKNTHLIKLFLICFFNIWNGLLLRGFPTIFNIANSDALFEENDAHVWSVLISKIWPNHKTFHTLIYTCSKEFDHISLDEFISLSIQLGPSILLAILYEVIKCIKMRRKTNPLIESLIIYNWMIGFIFFLLYLSTMRLKLFFMPQLFILSASLFRNSDSSFSIKISSFRKMILFAILIFFVSIKALPKLLSNLQHQAQFENDSMMDLLETIELNTHSDSIFGGSMSTMAAIMLSTGRRISNNPFYESSLIRQRTNIVYQLYSVHDWKSVHSQLCALNIDYVVVEPVYCYGLLGRCRLREIWEVEDNRTDYWRSSLLTKQESTESICHLLLHPAIDSSMNRYFQTIASNQFYHLVELINCDSIN
ncbi:uncharacterized protein NH340_JMT02360 [Sarcoptes scabiei]|nr:uncharacterized protein NH340_JMT02360 [Sarcoptes scabiei]